MRPEDIGAGTMAPRLDEATGGGSAPDDGDEGDGDGDNGFPTPGS
jgi:hypothetical protein